MLPLLIYCQFFESFIVVKKEGDMSLKIVFPWIPHVFLKSKNVYIIVEAANKKQNISILDYLNKFLLGFI